MSERLTQYIKSTLKKDVSAFLRQEFMMSEHGKDFRNYVRGVRNCILELSYEFFYKNYQDLLQSLHSGYYIDSIDFSVNKKEGSEAKIFCFLNNKGTINYSNYLKMDTSGVHFDRLFLPEAVVRQVESAFNKTETPRMLYTAVQDALCPVNTAISAYFHLIDKSNTMHTLLKKIPNLREMLTSKDVLRSVAVVDGEILNDAESFRIINEYNKAKGV